MRYKRGTHYNNSRNKTYRGNSSEEELFIKGSDDSLDADNPFCDSEEEEVADDTDFADCVYGDDFVEPDQDDEDDEKKYAVTLQDYELLGYKLSLSDDVIYIVGANGKLESYFLVTEADYEELSLIKTIRGDSYKRAEEKYGVANTEGEYGEIKLDIISKLNAVALKYNNKETPIDWNDKHQMKWYIVKINEVYRVSGTRLNKTLGAVYFTSEEVARIALIEIKDLLLKLEEIEH